MVERVEGWLVIGMWTEGDLNGREYLGPREWVEGAGLLVVVILVRVSW